MKVGMFYVDLGQQDILELAGHCIRSVHSVMPDAHIVQFTDMHTPALDVDEIIRRPQKNLGLMESRIAHFAQYDEDCLLIDPDLVVQEDISDIFERDFDVALTRRDKLTVDGEDAVEKMPFNTGVMFTRKKRGVWFWKAVLDKMKYMPEDDRNWFGDQISVAKVVAENRFKVLELPCEQYNYTPNKETEDVILKSIVHYKGKRKVWMLNRYL